MAACIEKIGVLLLVWDKRYPTAIIRMIYGFGTEEYDQSMVIFALWTRGSVGHYETVGIPHMTEGEGDMGQALGKGSVRAYPSSRSCGDERYY
jgi:hypothetical protein